MKLYVYMFQVQAVNEERGVCEDMKLTFLGT